MGKMTLELDEGDAQLLVDMAYARFVLAYRSMNSPAPPGNWESFWREEFKSSGQLLRNLLISCKRTPTDAPDGILQSVEEAK